MRNFVDSSLFQVLISIILFSLLFAVRTQGQWTDGSATFYLNAGGYACGYDVGKHHQISAVSAPLFNEGASCGACYEIKCVNSRNCYNGAGSIIVTVSDFCPSSNGPDAWCNPPQKHFDLSTPMFTKIAPYKTGIIPVQFRRVSCVRKGGVRFTINERTNQWWLEIVVQNVAGDGVVVDVKVKGSDTDWKQMMRTWGQNWAAAYPPNGQALSFQVTTSDGTLVYNNVAPANWAMGQTFNGRKNFR